MREVFADFALLGNWPGVGLSAPLGVRDLTDGERVVVIEPGELRAEAIVRVVRYAGVQPWFGVLANRDAVEDIAPGASSR